MSRDAAIPHPAPADGVDGADGVLTGVAGRPWRAVITASGTVLASSGGGPLEWYVAADDRWHRPSDEPTVRQVRLSGTPVTETRLRVPGGDAVQRVWSVADDGGHTVVEVVNESSLPFAVAFTRTDVGTSRQPTDIPIRGIVLPPDSIVLPVAHRTSVTITLAHDGRGPGRLPERLSTADAVVRGWTTRVDRASRLVLPDRGLIDAVVAARCDLILRGPPDAAERPAGALFAAAELVRLGEVGARDLDLDDLAAAVEDVAPRAGWEGDVALDAAARLLAAVGERRAGHDLARLRHDRTRSPEPAPSGVRGVFVIAAVERLLARDGMLLPAGIPAAWLGQDVEAYDVPTGPVSSVSFAVRWHGERPAVLWEQQGGPIELTAPNVDSQWRSRRASGEALWRHPIRSGRDG